MESVGGKVESVMFTRGAYDIVVAADVPDRASSMGLAMAVRASGSMTDFTVLEELDMKAVISAAQTAAKSFKPAG